MLPFDKKLREYLKKNAETVFILLVTAGGLMGRFFLWDIVSSDMKVYLKWYARAQEYGGLPGIYALGKRIKGYNALFQLLTAAMTHIPVDPLYLFKAVWTAFDILLAVGIGRLVYDMAGTRDRSALRKASLAYGFCFLAMDGMFNSAAWGQSDVVYVSLIVWSLVWLFKEKYLKAYIFLGLAFAFKLQTVFILPFFVFYYVYKKSFSCLYFICLPAMLLISALPRQIAGLISPVKVNAASGAAVAAASAAVEPLRLPGIIDVYLRQIASGGRMYLEYPSFWAFLPDQDVDVFADFYKFRNAAILFTLIVLAVLVAALLKSGKEYSSRSLMYAAMVLSFTTVFFLPTVIDRYGYLYEILAIVLVFLDKKSIIPAVALHVMMYYQIAGRVGVETLPISVRQLSLIMLVIYGIYLYLMFRSRKEDADAVI